MLEIASASYPDVYLDGNAEEVVEWFLTAPAGVPITPNEELNIGRGNNA